MKNAVIGTWRSYKAFFFSGKVGHHNSNNYIEITLDEPGNLTLLHSQSRRKATIYSADQWRVDIVKNQRYIYLGKKQAYEIITLDSVDMVLMDVVKGEKLFFAKIPDWQSRIAPVNSSVRHTKSEESSEHL